MSQPTADNSVLLDASIRCLQDLLTARDIPAVPPEELLAIEGFEILYATLQEVRNALMATTSGDLNYPIRKKGYVPGAIKGLQASLRHLTWQTKAIASGDFSQRVDFMGEFSEAFNSMVQQLDETMCRLCQREKELREMAHTDPLTGANNRGYFIELLKVEVERSRRYDRTCSVIMIDLDHFKSVNDTRGHAAGDEALRTLTTVLRSSGLRQSDFWGRIGGEEFAVTLPEIPLDKTAIVAERIRSNLAEVPVTFENDQFFITASLGASEYRTGDTQEILLHRADQALYQAKQTGRNRVCLTV